MAKGVAKDALQNSGTASKNSSQLFGDAGNMYGTLAPQLGSQAANPQGFGPTTLAKMDTASKQAAGGSMSAATGMGALRAARTKNAGASDASIADSSKTAGQQLSDATLRTQLANANEQQSQRQQAQQGEEGLYDENVNGANTALGLSNGALGIANQADQNNIWNSILMQSLKNGPPSLGGLVP